MKGICKKVNAIGVPTHVLIEPYEGNPILITVEEYSDQDISPPMVQLPVCPEPGGKIF